MGECSILNLFTFMLSLGNRVFGFSELISEIWPELWSAAPETSALLRGSPPPVFLKFNYFASGWKTLLVKYC